MFNLKIHKTVDNNYHYILTSLKFKDSSKRMRKFLWNSYDFKLINNLSRAKNTIFNIVNYNKFEFFYTQTINSVFSRSDLNLLISKFRNYTKYLRKQYNANFYYLIIPEYHQDKKNWHLHGLLSSAYGLDSYINDNGYLSVATLDKIGFNSISKIKNYTAWCKYITKYITKNIALDLKKGEHLYYCSQGLNRGNLVNNLVSFEIPPVHFDFKNDYVYKTFTNQEKYYNFINTINLETRFNYYNYN